MEVVLVKSVPGLGMTGSVVDVKSGYARNYLIPNSLAVRKTKESLRIVDLKKAEIEKERSEVSQKYEAVINTLKEAESVTIKVKTGGGDKLFGSVTNTHATKILKEKLGLDIDKRQVIIRDVIKTTGEYTLTVRLSKEHQIDMPFNVVAEESE